MENLSSGTEGFLKLMAFAADCLQDGLHSDVNVVAGDGTNFRMHKVILASASPVLRQILSENLEDEAWIRLPDHDPSTIKRFMELVYTGHVFLGSDSDRFHALLGSLGMSTKLAKVNVSRDKMRKALEMFKVDPDRFPRPSSVPFQIFLEKKCKSGWTPASTFSVLDEDDDDLEVEEIQIDESVEEIRSKHPSLIIESLDPSDKMKVWSCPICPENLVVPFSEEEKLKDHLAQHEPGNYGEDPTTTEGKSDDLKPRVCHKCKLAFASPLDLQLHICTSSSGRNKKRRKNSTGSTTTTASSSASSSSVVRLTPPKRNRIAKSNVVSYAFDNEAIDDDPDDPMMPPGFNPSDDEDEEYDPKKENDKRKGKTPYWSDDSADSSEADSLTSSGKRSFSRSKSKPAVFAPGTTITEAKPIRLPPIGTTNYRGRNLRIEPCIVCKGTEQTGGFNNGKSIDFDEKYMESCFHYAICYYSTGKFFDLIPPGDGNTRDSDGGPIDAMGKEMQYNCQLCDQQKKPTGYKSFFVHMVAVHGRLEDILKNDSDRLEAAAKVLDRYLTGKDKNDRRMGSRGKSQEKRNRCRLRGCGFVCQTKDMKELKEHYTLQHFKGHFTEAGKQKKPRIPVHVDLVRGIRCDLCSSIDGVERRIAGTREEIVVHYAVGHGKLFSAMKRRWAEPEVKAAIDELFPKKMEEEIEKKNKDRKDTTTSMDD